MQNPKTGTAFGGAIFPLFYTFLMNRYTINQVSFIVAGTVAHLFIAAVLVKEPIVASKAGLKIPSFGAENLRKIYTLPVIIYMSGIFLLLSGKRSQFPFFIPFAEDVGLTDYQPASILIIMNVADLIFRTIGGALSSTKTVRRYGQSIFVAIFVGAIGIMNLMSPIIIHDFQSFAVWAAVFGIFYALPVSSQYSSISEFTDVENTNLILSVNSLMLCGGVLVTPIINGALLDYTNSYWSTFYMAGSLMCFGAILCFFARILHVRRYSF